MTYAGWTLIVLFAGLIVALARPAGLVMHRLYDAPLLPGEATWRRWIGTHAAQEQTWLGYAVALMVFNLLGIAALFAILKLQGVLPLNPQHFGGVENWLAFNTAVYNLKPVFVSAPSAPRPSPLYRIFPSSLFGVVSGFWVVPHQIYEGGPCDEE